MYHCSALTKWTSPRRTHVLNEIEREQLGNTRYPEFDQITIFQMNLTVHMDRFDLHCQLWEFSIRHWDRTRQHP